MAPYGACEVAQSTARSKAQFEAERFRKGSRRGNTNDRKCCRMEKKCSKVLPNEKEACPSSAFERSVASKHVRAVISSALWPRMKKKHARPVISIAQWPSSATKSKLELCERPAATEHVLAVISSAQTNKLRLCNVFECWLCSLGFSGPDWSGEPTY